MRVEALEERGASRIVEATRLIWRGAESPFGLEG